jgi:TRAP-type C4-dicarboxylate transport system substrate-binding protein
MFTRIIFSLLLCSALSVPAFATTFKIATLSPDGSFWMNAMREGADKIKEKTQGRVKFKFYPGGVMGDDSSVMRKIRIRQLQGGAVTAGTISSFYSDGQVYSLPMLFRNLEEVSYVRKRLDPVIIENIEKNGFVTFGLAEGGFAYIMSLKEIKSIADLQNYKTWVPASDLLVKEAVSAYDVKPVPLSMGDVLTGLQTGLIQTVASPPIVTLALHWHTQIKYLMDMPLLYSYALLIIEKKSFKKLSIDDQKIVRDIMGDVFLKIDIQNRIDNVNAFAALKNQNITFIKPDAQQIDDWNKSSLKAQQHLINSGYISRPMFEKTKSLINDYRNLK